MALIRAGNASTESDIINQVPRTPRQTARLPVTRRSSEAIVDRTVADLNIEHFKKLLSTEVDPVKRRTIERLLAEEEAKLARAPAPKDDPSNKT
jgi:hypothetical protein